MPETINTKANERLPLVFEYLDGDGDKKDLTSYTISPVLYLAGTETEYLSGAAAGTVTNVDITNGKFSYLPAENIFVAGTFYVLRFLFINGNETYEKLDNTVEIRVKS